MFAKKSFYQRIIYILGSLFLVVTLNTACNKKSGCKINDNAHIKIRKDGTFKNSGKAKSGLYPKRMRKKMK